AEKLLVAYDHSNAPVLIYTYGSAPDDLLAVHDADSGEDKYFHEDGLKSVVVISDQGGLIGQQYVYDEFGNNLFVMDPAMSQPIQFAGRELDPETGLYYSRTRYYEPSTGRFLSPDLAGLAGGFHTGYRNLFSYAFNNPIEYRDPTGLWGIGITAGASG